MTAPKPVLVQAKMYLQLCLVMQTVARVEGMKAADVSAAGGGSWVAR
jgi:hypothetical protein